MSFNPIRKIKKLVERSYFYRRSAEKFLSAKTFRLDGVEYPYTIHPHNHTWTNERAVEISIAERALIQRKQFRTLEVGNVTRHYLQTRHDVVDKYEKADGVINVDIVSFSPDQKYSFILAISTLEHVGWDRDKKEPDKIITAVDKLKELLTQNGELLLTFPVGFNSFLDEFIEEGTLEFDQCHFLKRINAENEWRQVEWEEVKGTSYNSPYSNANAIVVASYSKNPR